MKRELNQVERRCLANLLKRERKMLTLAKKDYRIPKVLDTLRLEIQVLRRILR
jgi:hypothetical protein